MYTNRTPESLPDRSLLPLTNYIDSWNVRARFLLNEFARDPKDIEALAYLGSYTESSHTLLDAGAADGAFFERLAYEFLHSGNMIAVDINPEQFLRLNYPTFTDDQILKGIHEIKILDALLKKQPLQVTDLQIDEHEPLPSPYNWSEGNVSHLEFPDNSFDRVFALFMLYHVPETERGGALQEMKRVLKDDGVFVMATSGANNKSTHRKFEADIANNLGIEAPVRMNHGFTTEKAIEIVPEHFKYVFVLTQETDMVIKTEFEIAAYIASQVSLYNQYTPIPSEEEFQREMIRIEQNIRGIIENENENDHEFIDHISRSILIGTDNPDFVPGDANFVSHTR